jgi:hypothetical protein
MNRYTHEEALFEMTSFMDVDDSGDGFFRELRELATKLPEEPFSKQHFDFLLEKDGRPEAFKFHAYVFAMGTHPEVIPYAKRFFAESNSINTKLEYAAVMAQLGDESGYQYIEDVFQRFMQKEEALKDFDMEQMVFIFEEILTNERGQEMLARFRKEADYYVVWETLEFE